MEYKLTLGSYDCTLGSYECTVDITQVIGRDGTVIYTSANHYFYCRTGADWTSTIFPNLPSDVQAEFTEFIKGIEREINPTF